ncbi:polyadenylate-binding protein-interacting protein 5 isoform X2 [Carica papaya]|nr:polyadenylate-binding protein-interacting protein 5 isoform X2 [Carica papaya]
MEDFVAGIEIPWCMPCTNHTESQSDSRVSLDFDSLGNEKHISPEDFTKKKLSVPGSCDSLLQSPDQMADKQIIDDEWDVHMEFLKMHFPGLSDQSIADVYIANNGDLEATVDMLNQLEVYATESPEALPDTLDIGDVPESGTSTASTLKLKNVAGETGASASGSSDSAVAS